VLQELRKETIFPQRTFGESLGGLDIMFFTLELAETSATTQSNRPEVGRVFQRWHPWRGIL
jgi:hypothetical protein